MGEGRSITAGRGAPRYAQAALGALLALQVAAPLAGPPPSRPSFALWTATEIPGRCAANLREARRLVAGLRALPDGQAGVRTVLHALNHILVHVEDTEAAVDLLSNVSPDKAVREAAEACLLRYNAFDTALLQNARIHDLVKTVHPKGRVDAKFRQDMLDAFEDTGVALPPRLRVRMKLILERLEAVRQEFERNVRENTTRLMFTPEEMRGLPQSYLDRARRDAQGNYQLGFDYPEYGPFMANAEDEDARRRYQFAFVNRGTPRNMALLAEAEGLRREIAQLFGMKSYAEFSLRRKMARTPQAVQAFLDDVRAHVREAAAEDLEELRRLKAERTGQPLAGTAIRDWDVAYWRDKLRKARHAIDREALRAYFPAEAAIAWVMDLAGSLYGIDFRAAAAPVWHPDVRYVEVVDRRTGAFLGSVYLDLYPRDGKYTHAANFGVRSSSTLMGRSPIAVLVANLDRNGLDAGELATLTHEFGHTLHHVLARTAYGLHGGSGLEWDFVEAPSQMFEEWARRAQTLRRVARFCQGCPAVDDDLARRLDGARRLGSGLRYLDQYLLAQYDLELHGADPVDPTDAWARLESDTPLGHTPGTLFPSSFGHIVGGYAAGYYGYMWSEVLALDMLSPFGADLLDARVGRRYRDTVLARGGERPAARLVEDFLGRKPSNAAFIAEITGRRSVH